MAAREQSASIKYLADLSSLQKESLVIEYNSLSALEGIQNNTNIIRKDNNDIKKESKNIISALNNISSINKDMLKSINKLSGLNEKRKSATKDLKALGDAAFSVGYLMEMANKSSSKTADTIKMTMDKIVEGIEPIIGKSKELEIASTSLLTLSSGILKLGISLVLATPLYAIGSIGAIMASGTIFLLGQAFNYIDTEKFVEGSSALKDLSIGIVMLGGSLAIYNALVDGPEVFKAIGSIALLGTTMALVGLAGKEIRSGARAITATGIALGVLGLGLLVFKSTGVGLMDSLVASGSILLISGAFYIAGKFAGNILLGSLALTAASVPIFLLSGAMMMFKSTQTTLEDIGLLSGVILAAGGGAALAGSVAPLILLGSLALASTGLAMLTISYGLQSFKNISWTEDDAKNLTYALGSFRNAFGGGEEATGSILGAIGGMFKTSLNASQMILNAGSFIVAGTTLLLVSSSLSTFKNVGWVEQDTTSLVSAFAGVTKGFSILSDKKLQQEYGINTSPYQMYMAITSLAYAGTTLVNLAKGVKAFANLSFTNYVVKDGKLEISGVTKMTSKDIESAGNNIATVISVVGKAFADVGRLNDGGSSNNSILNNIFGGGKRYVEFGVSSLRGAGRTIINLAKGVKEFANLGFTEYDIKDGELVPIGVHKMSNSDIEMAGDNISKIVSTTGKVFAEVGKLNEGESSNNNLLSLVYGGGGRYVKTGVNALRGAGKTIINLAKGVQDFANLTITEYGVQDVDGTPTLVPISTRQMSEADLQSAGTNISKIISVVGKVFAEVGQLNAGQGNSNSVLGSIFGTGFVEQGVTSLSGVGENLNAIADAVPKYANLSFVKMGIENGKLVPKEVINLSENDIENAGLNISKILGIVAKSFAEVGKQASEGSGWFSGGYIEKGVKALDGVGENLSYIVDSTMKVASMQIPVYDDQGNVTSTITVTENDLLKAGQTIRKLLGTTAETVSKFGEEYGEGTEKNKLLTSGLDIVGQVGKQYGDVVEKLSSGTGESEQISESVSLIGTSMTNLIDNVFTAFNIEEDPLMETKLQMLERFTNGISTLSSSSQGMDQIAESFTKVGNSMVVFKDNINAIDATNLGMVDSLFNAFASLGQMSGGIENMSSQLKMTIEESMGKLAKILNEMGGTATQQLQTTQETLGVMKDIPKDNKVVETVKQEKREEKAANTQSIGSLNQLEGILTAILNEIRRMQQYNR